MKNLFTASIIALSVTVFSCSSNTESDDYNRAPAPGEASGEVAPAASANTFDPAAINSDPAAPIQPQVQNTGNVKHYICPAGHADGGSDAAGNCSVCGAELAHNDAFHSQPAQTQPQTVTPDAATNQPQITPATEPAKNAAGVFHYVCAEGHAGGSATAENCAVCGKQLVHNDKYHQ